MIPESVDKPRLWFGQVPEARTVPNRVRLDLRADDPDAEKNRLVGLGARVLAVEPARFVLADPEGDEFWLVR